MQAFESYRAFGYKTSLSIKLNLGSTFETQIGLGTQTTAALSEYASKDR